MSPAADPDPAPASRPRVEGDREQEILDAAIDVLVEVGYDRLTMDAVAAGARASKATLYRRWHSKADLIIDAMISLKGPASAVDTGTLRGDLLGVYCGMGGITDERQTALLCSVITAIGRDEEFAERFRRDFLGPKLAINEAIFQRAAARGEVRDDVDLDLLANALAGIVLHRQFLLGAETGERTIADAIDQIILPAATGGATPPTPPPEGR